MVESSSYIDLLSYVALFVAIIAILVYMVIRIKYGFWMLQPVFHIYNVNYMLNPPGIIDAMFPVKNKYTNFKYIDTIGFSQLSTKQQSQFIQLMQVHYLQNHDNIFSPTRQQVIPYFTGHSDKSFISFYYNDNHLVDIKTGSIIPNRIIIGSITSRPIQITIYNDNNSNTNNVSSFRAYYVDYLCVHTHHRKQGIAPQLIQTHHYNQRRLNKSVMVSLFKREDELTGIVPLCVYSTYGFPVDTWTKPADLSSMYKLLEINNHTFRFLHDFVNENQTQFDIFITTDFPNILELIKTNNVFAYAIMCDHQIIGCYFYRKSCTEVKKGLEVLSCFASICNCDEQIFIQGFKISFWKIAYEHRFGFSAIENISHNNIIITHIMRKTKPTIISPSAYFFYNFAYPTFSSHKTCILN